MYGALPAKAGSTVVAKTYGDTPGVGTEYGDLALATSVSSAQAPIEQSAG
jgi:hypothetical protein